MTSFLFAVRLEAVLRVRPFISKEATRYYLNGVFVKAGKDSGAICEATDGHRLGFRHDPEGKVITPAIIRLPAELKAPGRLEKPWVVAVQTKLGKGYIAIVPANRAGADEDTPESAMERIEDCTFRFGDAIIDGTFPDTDRVIPTPSDKDVTRSFNGEYFKSFGRAMTITGADDKSAHLIHIPGDPLFMGILMPMRLETETGIPEWLAGKKPKLAKAA